MRGPAVALSLACRRAARSRAFPEMPVKRTPGGLRSARPTPQAASMTSGISSSDAGLISSRLEENFLQIKEEGNHARWRGRTSNPVGDGSRSWVGSTPTAFRHIPCPQPAWLQASGSDRDGGSMPMSKDFQCDTPSPACIQEGMSFMPCRTRHTSMWSSRST